jgi:membrane protease YdiL (CAAX protease family)
VDFFYTKFFGFLVAFSSDSLWGGKESPAAMAKRLEEDPFATAYILSYAALVLTILGSCIYFWSSWAKARRLGVRYFPLFEQRRIQRWGLVDLVAVAACLIFFLDASRWMILSLGVPVDAFQGEGKRLLSLQFLLSLAQLAVVPIITMFLCASFMISSDRVGWSREKLADDIKLGVKTFCMVYPPVAFLMIVTSLMFQKPYEHPIVESVQNDPSTIWIAMWLAVVIAPITEEFAFRVMLQGFLEGVATRRFRIYEFLFGERKAMLVSNEDSHCPSELGFSSTISDERSLPWWPVIVAGVLFGLAHFDYGVSWIPLCVLGVALGALYRLTNRIWPSIVLHFCVNMHAIIAMGLATFGQ